LNPITNQQLLPSKYRVANGNGLHKVDIEISVVAPVCNEEGSIPILYSRVKVVLEGLRRPWELIFVDDGSQDKSPS
jgi:hypothetical protein